MQRFLTPFIMLCLVGFSARLGYQMARPPVRRVRAGGARRTRPLQVLHHLLERGCPGCSHLPAGAAPAQWAGQPAARIRRALRGAEGQSLEAVPAGHAGGDGQPAILIASGVESAMFLGVGALLGFLPLYAKNIVGLSDTSLGILLWVPLVMSMVGKPLAGRLSDRIGRKPMILVGLSLCVVMLPSMPLTSDVAGLLVEGAIFGLGMAIVTPSTMALVTDLCKVGHYGAALGVFGTIWDVGEALGPILMLAAFVGYRVGSIWGAMVAAAAVYLPSFILMLSMLPLLEHVKRPAWMRAALQGISPAVIGVTAVAVLRMVPYAIPDLFTGALAVRTVVALVLWRLSPLPLLTGGAAIGIVLRTRLS
jgi:MFS family permease